MAEQLFFILATLPTDHQPDYTPCHMTLAECQTFLGGWVEMVPSRNPAMALLVDEEGLLKERPPNAWATALCHPDTYLFDAIRGPALLIARQKDPL